MKTDGLNCFNSVDVNTHKFRHFPTKTFQSRLQSSRVWWHTLW